MVPVENALEFVTALRKQNVEFELHIFQKGLHGIALANAETSCGYSQYDDPHIASWLPLADGWLTQLPGNHAEQLSEMNDSRENHG